MSYVVKERFTVKRGVLYATIGKATRAISQGSWVPEGAVLGDLTSDELEVYGQYLEQPAKAVKTQGKKEDPPDLEGDD
jgi:hypothetical protein